MPPKKSEPRKLIIDLSGRGGLADKFGGDVGLYDSSNQLNNFTNEVNNRYVAQDNQLVSGYFNPVKKYGYLSPSVSTLITCTPAVSFTQLMAATQVDELNGDVYFFENGTKIQKATGLSDLTFTDDRTITGAAGTDLAIYTINDNRTLFYAYTTGSTSAIGIRDITATASPTFTANAGTDVITISGGSWELWENRAIQLTTSGTLPAGLALATTYYLKGVSGATAQLSLTAGGAAVDITDTGTGTHSISLFLDGWFGGLTQGKTKLVPAGDGFLYVLTKNLVYRIDGTTIGGANGTLSAVLLTAPEYFNFSHGIDYRSNLYLVVQRNTTYQAIGTHTNMYNSECGIYIWNRQSSFFNTSDYIPLFGVKEVRSIFVSPKGKIRIICVASNKTVQIREFDGTGFTTLKTLGYLSNPTYEDSVVVVGDFVAWLGEDGNLYYYGSDIPGEKEFLFVAGNVGTVGDGNTGSIAYAASGVTLTSEEHKDGFYLSWKDASAYYVKNFRPFTDSPLNATSMFALQGDIYTPTKLLPRLSTVKHIDIYLAQYPHSSSLTTAGGTIKIYFNNSSTAWASKSVTRGDIAKGYLSIEVNKPFINSVQLELEYPTDVGVGMGTVPSALMNPSFAVVEFEDTKTLK